MWLARTSTGYGNGKEEVPAPFVAATLVLRLCILRTYVTATLVLRHRGGVIDR